MDSNQAIHFINQFRDLKDTVNSFDCFIHL